MNWCLCLSYTQDGLRVAEAKEVGLEAFQGYTENGIVILLADQAIPDGRRAIITILDEPMTALSRQERQKKALQVLEQGLTAMNHYRLNMMKYSPNGST